MLAKLCLSYAIILVLMSGSARLGVASGLLHVSMDTSALSGTAARLAFDFIDGDATLNNTVTISDFSTDGILGAASSVGGVAGLLPAPVSITDSAFFNELDQSITLGTHITFTLSLTQVFTGGTPDALSAFLLDATATFPLFMTTDPTFADALLVVDIDGSAFGAFTVFSPTSSPAAVTTVTGVPELSSLLLVTTGVLGLLVSRRWWVQDPMMR